MSLFLYAGLKAKFLDFKTETEEDQFHLTLMFAPLKATPRFYLQDLGLKSYGCDVTDVVYWEHVGLTVALIKNKKTLQARFDMYSDDLGFVYDYEFVPHVTLGKGDLTSEYNYLIDTPVDLYGEYIKIVERH